MARAAHPNHDRYYALNPTRANRLTHVSHRHRFVYVSMPKSGCSVVKTVLQYAELGRYPDHGASIHDRDASPLAAPYRDGLDLDELFGPGRPYLVFTFVRNPFSRALSGYLQKILAPGEEQRKRRAALGFGPEDEVTYRDFLRRVAATPPRKVDGHFMPQALLGAFDRLRYGFVGRFESFEQDMVRLVGAADLDVPADVWSTPTKHTTGARRKLEEYYEDRECIRLVREIHRRDFELLGYGRDVRFA